MNKFIRKLFLKLGLISSILPFNSIQILYGETLNNSFENNINEVIYKDAYILGPAMN